MTRYASLRRRARALGAELRSTFVGDVIYVCVRRGDSALTGKAKFNWNGCAVAEAVLEAFERKYPR